MIIWQCPIVWKLWKDEGGFVAYFQNSDCETHMLWL